MKNISPLLKKLIFMEKYFKGGFIMRLDKFLMDSKIVKRRVIAHDLCDGGKVTKGSLNLKPGYEVKPGDIISVELPRKILQIKISEENSFEVISESLKNL